MGKRKNHTLKTSQELVFEKVYQKYYVDLIEVIHSKIKEDKMIYPSSEERQLIIDQSLKENCSLRFIDVLDEDIIMPLFENDKLYLFPKEPIFKNKDFFRLIQPAFLIPYFLYARFAYELASKVKAHWSELIKVDYQIDLPLKLPNENEYRWYSQISRILSINKNNQVVSHINLYLPGRKFLEIDDKPENMFIQATVFARDKSVYKDFQNLLEDKMTEYYRDEVFIKEQHRRIIRSHTSDPSATKDYTTDTIFFYNKEINDLMKVHTGYNFKDIKHIVSFLESIGVTGSNF